MLHRFCFSSLRTLGGLLVLFFCLLLFFCLPAASPATAQDTGVILGTVIDADTDTPLPGASVVIDGTTIGTATDLDGQYRLEDLEAGTYTLVFSFVGYETAERLVTLAAGGSEIVDIVLAPGGFDLNTIIVSASRQREQVLDAPASISVLDPREIQQDVAPSASTMLRNTTGVDAAQTGVDRTEIVLRGFNNAFSGAAYVLTDYRQAAAPSLGVNVYSIMPAIPIDLEAVEIVRGPGSALYGPGVDAGVVHYLSKDPFDDPSTTISVQGGSRSLLGIAGRHAGLVNENLGYKITGTYARANDWELDPDNELDAAQLASDAPGLERDYDYSKYNVNAMAKYRFDENLSVTANAGYSAFSAIVLSGIGTLGGDNFSYTYGQLRLDAGGFFAQTYLNRNDAGDSFVYGTGASVVDNSSRFVGQAQYNFDVQDGRYRFIVGADYQLITPDTDGTIYGRNEDDDQITEAGLYAQTTLSLTDWFDLTLAGRGDYNDVIDDFQLSPRVAAVVKPAAGQSIRATYNRAFSSPGRNSLFLDIVARAPDVDLPFAIRGRGAVDGYTFLRNGVFNSLVGSDLVAYGLNGCLGPDGLPLDDPGPACGVAQPVGLPIDAVYASVYGALSAIPTPQLAAIVRGQLGLTAEQLPDAVVAGLVAGLDPNVTPVGENSFSRGELALLNLSATSAEDRYQPINDVANISPLDQTTTQTFEVGYKGALGGRVLVAVDGYYTRKENFVGPLQLETPFVFVPNLAADLGTALATGIAGNAQLAAQLQSFGLSPQQVAGLVVGLAADQLPGAQTPVAIVAPEENLTGGAPELLLTYRNFGRVEFYGVDVSTQIIVNDEITAFANASFVSDDYFDNEELDETNTSLALALNAPTFKAKAGFTYRQPQGFAFNVSGRFVKGFPVFSGPYTGGRPAPFNDDNPGVEDYFILDLGAGYDFGRSVPGLRFDVTALNVLNNERREFIGAPEIGLQVIGRLNFTF